jgi:hypothetical protein
VPADASCVSRFGDTTPDRMLVRVSHTYADSVGVAFDENQNMITQHLQYEDWAEFMVVWRGRRLELYEDYVSRLQDFPPSLPTHYSFRQSLPGKEWVTKHKHLAFVVPLDSLKTKFSLYSFVDMTFCFVCPPTPVLSVTKNRLRFHTAKSGLNVFVFKVKVRSRAQDWIWKLWCVHRSCRFGIITDR